MIPCSSMATTVPDATRLPGLTSFTRPDDKRINARRSAFGPKTPRTETEFLFNAPRCVAALFTLAFGIFCGSNPVRTPCVSGGEALPTKPQSKSKDHPARIRSRRGEGAGSLCNQAIPIGKIQPKPWRCPRPALFSDSRCLVSPTPVSPRSKTRQQPACLRAFC